MVKRLVDVVVSAALLLLALPMLVIAALLIALTSPGPVLFRQTRMGRSFETFEIVKLRTMAHAAPGLAYTLGPDPRITPIGAWLRRTKLDELPQLWNVLLGEMSLVGPRPVLPELTFEFRDYYAYLLRFRPGLTDPASLKYYRETSLLGMAPDPMRFFKTVVTPDKIRISLEYMNRANLWTDIVTLAMTAVICCFPSWSSIYGRLPEVSGEPWLPESPENLPVLAFVSEPDGAAFSPQLAYLAAVADEAGKWSDSPWIPLTNPKSGLRSASSGAREGASQL